MIAELYFFLFFLPPGTSAYNRKPHFQLALYLIRLTDFPDPQRKQSEFTGRGGALQVPLGPTPLTRRFPTLLPTLLIWTFAFGLPGHSPIQQGLSQRELFLGTNRLFPSMIVLHTPPHLFPFLILQQPPPPQLLVLVLSQHATQTCLGSQLPVFPP